ncbi:MAG: hypothetical protein IMF05_09915, partial [Proteobacteria bacterium]|nr:hypothetical protein [Pseudomonadota bacterium]
MFHYIMTRAALQQEEKDHKNISGIDQVFAEQVRLIYSGVFYATLVTLTVGAILVYAHRQVASVDLLVGWSAYMLAGLLIRNILVWRFHAVHALDRGRPAFWLHLYVATVVLLGAGWGSAGIFFMPPESPPHQFLTAFILGATAVGSMSILAVVYA